MDTDPGPDIGVDDLELIRLLSRAAATAADLDPALRTFAEVVCDHVGGAGASVWRRAGRGWVAVHRYRSGPAVASTEGDDLPDVVGAMLRADVPCSVWHQQPDRDRRAAVLVRGSSGPTAVLVLDLDEATVTARSLLAVCEVVADLLEDLARRHEVTGRSDQRGAVGDRALEYDLRAACEQWSFDIAYQPVVSLDDGALVGTEALVRWRRPGHGPMSPADFVPVVERLGLAPRLGAQVLLDACNQTAAWRRADPAARDLTIAVNLSVRQLDELDVVEVVEEALDRSGLPPEALVLELTESALPTDAAGALARLWALRHLGVSIAIDDFGTGYSSLSRLRELPVDVLKVDRSFLADPDRDHAILEALFAMARTLGLATVAEGVETPDQLHAVLANGCDLAQGYLFARPLPAEGVTRLLHDPDWDTDELTGGSAEERSWTPTDLDQLLTVHGDAEPWEDLEELLRATAHATGTDSVYLTTVDVAGGVQHIDVAANTAQLEVVAGTTLPWATSPCRRALRDEVAVLHDVTVGRAGLALGTVCSVPVEGPDGTLRGTLCAVSAPRRIPGDVELELLRRIAQLVGTEVGRTREHAWIDALTGDGAAVA